MAIEIENLTKRYGLQNAVDNISFKVNTREVLGFLGPNGAGKSTTMKIIACFIAPHQGDVRLDNLSIHSNPDEIKRRIGYLPENNPLYLDMYVMDYLFFVASIQRVEKSTIDSRVREMVGVCGLSNEKHKRIGELSKGYRQRVGLAQAIIHNPEVLILDEPTSGLDPNQIVEIRKLIKELGKEKTVILSTHILPEVEATCDRILIINRGRLVADGSPSDLRKQAQGQEILNIQLETENSPATIKEKLMQLNTVASVESEGNGQKFFKVVSKTEMSSRKNVFRTCVDNNWILLEMTGQETRLEDVFRELTN
ncbi:MAG: gliding motility-associated ABC transporter ATP-binding subunit GldA [Bacteroidetes bacterium RIFCSPLOWO2_02_FULL_36_8]|nr:MAG: gliding motility-associated ABC transporter ATP-binding subunit GldA [Bacteroidetes bacterium RIFCSPLOWO2_02_FULL_36_8]OFY70297.1 MAG: gliding motility-associated ABC transporter ATP-binding subunit GldA [Bacteroidetes bacterium RIFCSPLOWO2_12_FULL_37_12]